MELLGRARPCVMGFGNREGPGLVSDLKELTDAGETEILQHGVKCAPWGGHRGTGGDPWREPQFHNVAL